MGKALQRRTIYAATIVAILAMVGGFALAGASFLGFTSTSVNGNQGVINVGNTIYSLGVNGSELITGAGGVGGACTAPSSSATAHEVFVTAWFRGGPGACTTTPDYIYQLNFTSANPVVGTSPFSDKFVISSEFGTAITYTTDSVTVVCTLTTETFCQADINIDTGVATTSPQPAVEAVDITVSGS